MEKKQKKFLSELYEWIETIVVSIAVVAVVFTFFFRVVNVDGDSMNNTLLNNDKLVITSSFYTPKKGDIVIISRSDAYSTSQFAEPLVKRVIATEGQTVDIDFENGIVYVDGNALNEPYIKEPTYHSADVQFPVTVDKNCVFVLGDNRNNSRDSRFSDIGMISRDKILGKVMVRVYPFNTFKLF